FREGLRRFNGSIHDQASSVCGSVVGCKVLSRKLATKCQDDEKSAGCRSYRAAAHAPCWQTCAAGSKHRDAFATCRTRYSFSRVRDRMLRCSAFASFRPMWRDESPKRRSVVWWYLQTKCFTLWTRDASANSAG